MWLFSWSGDDSLDEMSMNLVQAIFLSGFLVEKEALEAILGGKLMSWSYTSSGIGSESCQPGRFLLDLEVEIELKRRMRMFEVFSTDDLGLDWISTHNFLTCLQQLSSYTSGHLEVSESAACLEKLHFPTLLVMAKFSRICFSFVILEVPLSEYFGFDMNYALNFLCSI
ncbi:hypothetical protein Tco_0808002 [Tanacetum coccineum]